MVDQRVGAQQVGNVQRLGNVGIALDKFKGAIRDLHFAGPFALVAGDTNLGAGNQLGGVLFGAGQLVQEVSAVGALAVNGDLVVPPGLMGLDVGLDHNLGFVVGGHIVGMAHCGDNGSGVACLGFSRGGGVSSRSGDGSDSGSDSVLLGTGGEGQNHCQNQKHGNQLFHVSKLLFHISYHGVRPHYTTGFMEINLFYGVFSAFH